jgi:hypothetical protein
MALQPKFFATRYGEVVDRFGIPWKTVQEIPWESERMNEDRIVSLLGEIRDNQRQALEQQRAQLEIARGHFEQARVQIAESLKLQQEAVRRQRTIGRIALPALLFCIAAIVYLVWRYF